MFLIIVLISVLIMTNMGNSQIISHCQTPNNKPGICIEIQQCSQLYSLVQYLPISSTDIKLLRDSSCGRTTENKPKVCCENRDPSLRTNLLPKPGVCGSFLGQRIFGGNETAIDEFPWMAMIQYSKPKNQTGFHCGGALISDRYILTAAHCISGAERLGWQLSKVRLGEWDTNSDPDCDRADCADPHLDIMVEKTIVHDQYDHSSVLKDNDIALLRLASPVNYTDFIKPICVPTYNLSYATKNLQVAGWGQTEYAKNSNIKLKVSMDEVDIDSCKEIYKNININLVSNQMCAGGKTGEDTCLGDSGGPLMSVDAANKRETLWYIMGIVSFGPRPCGQGGQPAVYTRVIPYIEWISENVKP